MTGAIHRRALALAAGLLALILFGGCASGPRPLDAGDPFAPYLTRRPPRIVQDLGEESHGSVRLRRVVFHSRTVPTPQGPQDSRVFAMIARPVPDGTSPRRYPGMLVIHGGAQAPEPAKAIGWAEQGYVVVVPDVPGIIDPKKAPHSTGPWKGPYGSAHITASPDLTACSIFDGVLAAVQALYLLRAQPDVIPDRIGVTGVSWGGYTATMVCGIAGDDVTAAFSVYGCGFYDLGSAWQQALARLPGHEARLWLDYLDAGRRAHRISAAYFIAAAANDHFYWPPAVNATLQRVPGSRGEPPNQLFAPNAGHWAPVPGGTKTWTGPSWLDMEVPYFAWHLKAQGQPPPRVITAQASRKDADSSTVRFTVASSVPLQQAQVWHTSSTEAWEKRKWQLVDATPLADGRYEATIPSPAGTPTHWFALVSDARPMTVSSLVNRID